MAWIRLSDDYNDHPKFDNLSDGAFRLWHQAMGFCRKFQTDGLIPIASVRKFKSFNPKRQQELMTPWKDGEFALWDVAPDVGVQIHDYLEWNLSKVDEQQQRDEARQRMSLGRDPDIRRALRARDGTTCRYCGRVVSWADRRGPAGGTYDHVDPSGGDTIENLVIACRGCNGKKGRRTPEGAGMPLRPPGSGSGSGSGSRSESKSHLGFSGYGEDLDLDLEKGSGEKPATSLAPDAVAARAGALIRRYAVLYTKHRNGAKLRLIGNSLEFHDACSLVELWDDARLDKLAVVVLETDDSFISGTDRSFKIFAIKASWADDKLKEWELEHGVIA